MADGSFRKLVEIQVGDKIMSYDTTTGISLPTTVVRTYRSGTQKVYRSYFSDGAYIDATMNHTFPCIMGSGRFYISHCIPKKRKTQKRPLSDLIARLDNSVSKRVSFLSPVLIDYQTDENLPIHPYALGALLGDGSLKSHVQITTADPIVFHRVFDALSLYVKGYSVDEKPGNAAKTYRFQQKTETRADGQYPKGFLNDKLRELGLAKTNCSDKFIPPIYLRASVENREQLLAGLIDTDGFRLGFTVKSKRLAEGFATLVRSLGGKATIQAVRKECKNNGVVGDYFNVYWRLNRRLPLELPYKQIETTRRPVDYSRRILRSVKYIGDYETGCLEVEHPDHCFIVGDYIAVGNSDQGAYECILAVTGRHPYKQYPANGKGWIVGLDFNMSRDVCLPKFNKLMPRNYTINSDYSKADRIWWIEGEGRQWEVQFKSSDSGRDRFQGAEVDWIWFDEEPCKTDIFAECMMRLVDKAGTWWMTATPINGTAWLKQLSERDDISVTFGAMWDNPYLPLEEVEKAAAELTEEEKLVRIEGQYIVFAGSPVFNIRLLTGMINNLKNDIPISTGIIESCAA